jgi:nucleotide-binding universal stress UspA family protein
MDRILITTDFSPASRHALEFAASLLAARDASIELVHVYSVSVTHAADGASLAAFSEGFSHAERLMKAELDRLREVAPEIHATARVLTGNFLETLRDEVVAIRPRFIVLGTAGFGDLYLGDTDPLDALKLLRAPVLFIPEGAPVRPIRKLAYACNYRYTNAQRTPVKALTDWVSWIGASLRVVHVDPQERGADPRQRSGEAWLHEALDALQPQFDWVVDTNVLRGLSGYLSNSDADCVVAVPRRYGFWESLFHESRTKALARMNRLPVIAIPEL